MGEQVSNDCYINSLRQECKWHADTLDGKYQNSVVTTRTVVHTEL